MGFDKDKAKKNMEAILDRMHGDTNIFMLKEYHKLYKKEVSLFKRSWTAAWLLMYYDMKETPPAGRPSALQSKEKPAKSAETKNINPEERTQIEIPEEEAKKLFISIGKNRRLFPREIITLIMSKTKAAREDIGNIKILDNYSFVQVRDKKADEIIEALNGIKFRGRTLTVNYAKPKNEESV